MHQFVQEQLSFVYQPSHVMGFGVMSLLHLFPAVLPNFGQTRCVVIWVAHLNVVERMLLVCIELGVSVPANDSTFRVSATKAFGIITTNDEVMVPIITEVELIHVENYF